MMIRAEKVVFFSGFSLRAPPGPCAMQLAIHYGLQSTIELDLPCETLVARFDRPEREPIDDPAAATRAALARPIGYPSIDRAVVPGDRITLALCGEIPQVGSIVAGVVGAVMECGIRPEDLTILRSSPIGCGPTRDPREKLDESFSRAISLIDHDPLDRRQLSYLAASSRRQPILFHRALHDADVVLPISRLGPSRSPGYGGAYGGIFPRFSDAATIERLPMPPAAEAPQRARDWQEQLDEAGWLLGIAAIVTILPAREGGVLDVLAGDVRQVHEVGTAICDQVWRFSVPQRAAMVVAAISGDATEQSWDNLTRAVAAVQRIVDDRGAVALCTELSHPPPAPLRRIGDAEDLERELNRAAHDRAGAAWQAVELIRAQLGSRVYLLSHVDEELVRQTGMIPITKVGDLVRLIRRHDSCILMGNAQYVSPQVEPVEATDLQPTLTTSRKLRRR
jgi:nickel-dependent lactate racemase